MDLSYKQQQTVKRTALLLQQLIDGRTLEEPHPDFKSRIETYKEAELVDQEALAIHEMRVEQFKALGFVPMSPSEAVELLKGEPHTSTQEQSERNNYDYMFRHSEFTLTKGDTCTWGSKPEHYLKTVSDGKWFLPPFGKKVVWRVEPVYKLSEYVTPVPTELLQALMHLRKKGFFNWYYGLQCKDTGDTVILGVLSQLAEGANKSGETEYFYIGSFGKE